MNDMEHRGPGRRTPAPESSKTGRKKSKLPPIVTMVALGVVIGALLFFNPSKGKPSDGSIMKKDDILLLDQRIWEESVKQSLAAYTQVKLSGFKLGSNQLDREDTLRYCDDMLVYFGGERERIEGYTAQEDRGDAPEYMQTCLRFYDAARDVVLALRTEAEKDPGMIKVSLAEFEAQTQECDDALDALREARITFMTPARSKQQIADLTRDMDTAIAAVK